MCTVVFLLAALKKETIFKSAYNMSYQAAAELVALWITNQFIITQNTDC